MIEMLSSPPAAMACVNSARTESSSPASIARSISATPNTSVRPSLQSSQRGHFHVLGAEMWRDRNKAVLAAKRLRECAAARARRHIVDAELLEPPSTVTIETTVAQIEPERAARREQQTGHRRSHTEERRGRRHALVESGIDLGERGHDIRFPAPGSLWRRDA
jgi:hypothetical protein